MTQKTEPLPFSAQHILNSIPGGVLVTDADGSIQVTNPSLTDITGFDTTDLVGQNPRLFHSGRHNRAFYRKMWRALAENGAWKGEIYNRRKNGEIYSEFLTINALKDPSGAVTH